MCGNCKSVAYCSKKCQVCAHHTACWYVRASVTQQTHSHTQSLIHRAQKPFRTLPLDAQAKAWEAGHKKECAQASFSEFERVEKEQEKAARDEEQALQSEADHVQAWREAHGHAGPCLMLTAICDYEACYPDEHR